MYQSRFRYWEKKVILDVQDLKTLSSSAKLLAQLENQEIFLDTLWNGLVANSALNLEGQR